MSRPPYIRVDGVPVMPPRVRQIIEAVARAHGLTVGDLVGVCQQRSHARARWEAYAKIIAQLTINGEPPSLPQMGRWFNRDHTTVLYGLRRHCSDLTWKKGLQSQYRHGRTRFAAPIRVQLVADMAERSA